MKKTKKKAKKYAKYETFCDHWIKALGFDQITPSVFQAKIR